MISFFLKHTVPLQTNASVFYTWVGLIDKQGHELQGYRPSVGCGRLFSQDKMGCSAFQTLRAIQTLEWPVPPAPLSALDGQGPDSHWPDAGCMPGWHDRTLCDHKDQAHHPLVSAAQKKKNNFSSEHQIWNKLRL